MAHEANQLSQNVLFVDKPVGSEAQNELPIPQSVANSLLIKSEQNSEIKLPAGVTVGTMVTDNDGRTEVKTAATSGLLTPTVDRSISHSSQESPELDTSKVKSLFKAGKIFYRTHVLFRGIIFRT